jgi:hypothetical protein
VRCWHRLASGGWLRRPEPIVPDPEPQLVDRPWDRKTAHLIQDWMRKARNALGQAPSRHAKTHQVGGGDALPTPGLPVSVSVGGAAAAGDGPAYAREDHVHALSLGLTTKGDLLTRSGAAYSRLGVGANGFVLTADSGEPTGLKWAASAAGSSDDAMAFAFFMGD